MNGAEERRLVEAARKVSKAHERLLVERAKYDKVQEALGAADSALRSARAELRKVTIELGLEPTEMPTPNRLDVARMWMADLDEAKRR